MTYTKLDLARKAQKEAIHWAELRRDGIIDRLAVWGPMAIPLIPAGLTLTAIGTRYHTLLNFPAWASWPIGVVSGAGVEVFGIVANENYLDMQRYNQTLREGEERAPEEEARKARNTYMAIVVGLMTTLEVIPVLNYSFGGAGLVSTISVLISLFPLVFLAVLAGQVIVMRKQHAARVEARREREIETEKRSVQEENDELNERLSSLDKAFKEQSEQLKAERGQNADLERELAVQKTQIEMLKEQNASVAASLERYQEHSLSNGNTRSTSRPKRSAPNGKSKQFERRIKVLNLYKQNGEMSLSDVADKAGSSKSTISNDLDYLESLEVIHRNVNAETGKTTVAVNGNEPAFRAGEIG